MSRALVDYVHYNMANYWVDFGGGKGNINDPLDREGKATSEINIEVALSAQQTKTRYYIESLKIGGKDAEETQRIQKVVDDLNSIINDPKNTTYMDLLKAIPTSASFQGMGVPSTDPKRQDKMFVDRKEFNDNFQNLTLEVMSNYIQNIVTRFCEQVITPLNKDIGKKGANVNDYYNPNNTIKGNPDNMKNVLDALDKVGRVFNVESGGWQAVVQEGKQGDVVKNVLTAFNNLTDALQLKIHPFAENSELGKALNKVTEDTLSETSKNIGNRLASFNALFRFSNDKYMFLDSLVSNLKGEFAERWLTYVINEINTIAISSIDGELKSVLKAAGTGAETTGYEFSLSEVYTSPDYIDLQKDWGKQFTLSKGDLSLTSKLTATGTKNKADMNLKITWTDRNKPSIIGFTIKAYKPKSVDTQRYILTAQSDNNLAMLLLGTEEGFAQHYLNLVAAHSSNTDRPPMGKNELNKWQARYNAEITSLMQYQALASGNILKTAATDEENLKSHIFVLFREGKSGKREGIEFAYTESLLSSYQDVINKAIDNYLGPKGDTSKVFDLNKLGSKNITTTKYQFRLMFHHKNFLYSAASELSKNNSYVDASSKKIDNIRAASDARLSQLVSCLRRQSEKVEMYYKVVKPSSNKNKDI